MNKPIILVFCGKSASGKDTVARWVKNQLNGMLIKTRLVVSDTTRPPRVGEEDGKDYHFVTKEEFNEGLLDEAYIEWAYFRDWMYGVRKDELTGAEIYTVVLNPRGLENLKKYRRQYQIIPVYLQDRLIDRMRRSRDRENGWKLEHFRRAFSDWKDFLGFKRKLLSFNKYIIIKNENGVQRKCGEVLFALQEFKIIAAG